MRKLKPCKYCQQGISLRDGEHWIVKSIMPAHIKIVKCTAQPVEVDRG